MFDVYRIYVSWRNWIDSFAKRFEYINDENIYYEASTIEKLLPSLNHHLNIWNEFPWKHLKLTSFSWNGLCQWYKNVHIAHKLTNQQMFYWWNSIECFRFFVWWIWMNMQMKNENVKIHLRNSIWCHITVWQLATLSFQTEKKVCSFNRNKCDRYDLVIRSF